MPSEILLRDSGERRRPLLLALVAALFLRAAMAWSSLVRWASNSRRMSSVVMAGNFTRWHSRGSQEPQGKLPLPWFVLFLRMGALNGIGVLQNDRAGLQQGRQDGDDHRPGTGHGFPTG